MGKLHEECGIFGIYNLDNLDVADETYLALYALQHRGQESCGIAVNDSGVIISHKDLGLVPDVFTAEKIKQLGKGNIAVGHVRYSPGNNPDRANSQPLVMRYIKGSLAIANNGSLVNNLELKAKLEENGAIFQTTCDAEIIAYMIARERVKAHSIEAALVKAMEKLKGAYTLTIMSPQKLIAARDPNGFRPLCIGKIKNSYCVASESCVLNSIGAEFIRDVKPGEVIVIDEKGLKSIETHCNKKTSMCIFEFVYFARPDSVLDGQSVNLARQKAGELLAKSHPVDADVVVGVPDSGLDAALGYANYSKIPYGIGFVKNKYIGRTFIQDKQKKRERSVGIKLNPMSSAVKGKRVILVDDSIVRGTTCAKIVAHLRKAGATEVHMRISSPLFLNPCYFGTDIDSRDKLIACRMSVDEIRDHVGADSLGFLKIDQVHKIAPDAKEVNFCDACFSGNYPMEVPSEKPIDKYGKKIGELDTLFKI